MSNRFGALVRQLATAHADVLVVVGSGIVGGLLATAVQALVRSDGNLTTFVIPQLSFGKYLLFGTFGAIAAAVSVYVAANSRREDLKHLCFFALSCGIAFPAILLKTIDPAAQRALDSLESATVIAANEGQPVDERAAVSEVIVRDALAESPAKEVDAQTKAIISRDTSQVIKSLESQRSPIAMQKARSIFDAATEAGYTGIEPPAAEPVG